MKCNNQDRPCFVMLSEAKDDNMLPIVVVTFHHRVPALVFDAYRCCEGIANTWHRHDILRAVRIWFNFLA
jgi:hypothetical protein